MNSRQRRKQAAAKHQIRREFDAVYLAADGLGIYTEQHQRKLEAMRKNPQPRNSRTSLVMCAMVATLSAAPAIAISEPKWKQKKRKAQPSW